MNGLKENDFSLRNLSLKKLWHSAVARNYSHLTVAAFAATLISLIIYPIAIRRLGEEQYGYYVFGLALMNYFVDFVVMGMRMPSVKLLVEAADNRSRINHIISCMAYIRTAMSLVCALVFIVLLFSIDSLRQHAAVYLLAFLQLGSSWLLPQSYFQAQQRMQYITYPAIVCRLLTIPLIVVFVKSPSDLALFVLFSSLSVLAATILPLWQMFVKEGVKLVRVNWSDVVKMLCCGSPFFVSNIIVSIREHTTTVLIGLLLGMSEVSIYDLAKKVVMLPRMFIQNINQAVFPDAIGKSADYVRKVLRIEYVIGCITMLLVVALGYWAVLLLGGEGMTNAYYVAILLSTSTITWLVKGGYVYMVFIPQDKSMLVLRSQIVAFTSFFAVALPLLFWLQNVYALAIAFCFSGIAELMACRFFTKKLHLI